MELNLSVPDLSQLLNLDPKPLGGALEGAGDRAPTLAREVGLGGEDKEALVADDAAGDGDSSFALQCGSLSLSADVERGGREAHGWVRGVTLDDFELGSLRGVVNEARFGAEVDSNSNSNQGRVSMDIKGLKYENLMSESFKTSLRWD